MSTSTGRNRPTRLENSHGRGKLPHQKAAVGQVRSWQIWSRKLSTRKTPQTLRKLLPASDEAPLLWGLAHIQKTTADGIRQLDRLRRKPRDGERKDWDRFAQRWQADLGQRAVDTEFCLECLAWCHALPALATRVSESTWWRLFESLLKVSDEANIQRPHVDGLSEQLLAGELRLSLAYLLPEIPTCFSLRESARDVLSAGLVDLLDGEGMPHARSLPNMRGLLACWTRSLYVDAVLKQGRISKPARLQFQWLVTQVLRWARSDSSPILAPLSDDCLGFEVLMTAALRLTGDKAERILMDILTSRRKRSPHDIDLPNPAEHYEWSELAVLRTDWSIKASTLAVDYHERSMAAELATRGHVLWSGDSFPRVHVDDQPLRPTSDWEELCWESDRDVDYVELEIAMGAGWRMQRQMMLARKDGFAFVADALLGDGDAAIAYAHPLPVGGGVSLRTATETREAFFENTTRLATLLPLALPEWRADPRGGDLRSQPAELIQQRQGKALYAPLFIDLDSGRKRKALTWRQLTVGENLQIVPADVAVAYRVQIGKQQWVFYRSLAPPANRTFLGLNITSEFLAARFDTTGEVDHLIEVE